MTKELELTDVSAAVCCEPLADTALDVAQSEFLAPKFKALGDPVRLRLLSMIASAPAGEMCVCDLTPGFDVSGPTISHHLKVLREAGLIVGERRGTWVYYRPVRERLSELAKVLEATQPA
ncbi:MAG TPA: metalloregulator ArsR/SmtB family transcription factor [Jiangellaceae bacterium]